MKSNAFLMTRDYIEKHLGLIVTFTLSAILVIGLSLSFTTLASAQTYTPITAQVGPGARNANVTAVQTFLAANPAFYPEGLVTGYYGSLTVAAVQRFQAFYGIASSGTPTSTGYGRVGPSTMAKMNALIAGGTSSTDTAAPYISGLTLATSTNGATLSFSTNELATSRVYFDTAPIRFVEGNEFSVGFAVTSGQSASYDASTRTVHGATLSGLSANTNYYYLIVVTDPSGNVSISTPGAWFRTGF